MVSAMKNNAKLIFRAKKKRVGSCTKGFFCFTSYKFKKQKKNVCKQSSLLLYLVLCNYPKLIRQI